MTGPYRLGFLNEITYVIGKKWVLLILVSLGKYNKMRFNQIRDHFEGINSSTLSSILKELEHYELVQRTAYEEIPIRVEYRLSDTGNSLLSKIKPFLEWSEKISINSQNNTKNGYPELLEVAVEHALLIMGMPEVQKIRDVLIEKYHCTIPETFSHPQYLRDVLIEQFGRSYNDILDTIKQVFDKKIKEQPIQQFMSIMEEKNC